MTGFSKRLLGLKFKLNHLIILKALKRIINKIFPVFKPNKSILYQLFKNQ